MRFDAVFDSLCHVKDFFIGPSGLCHGYFLCWFGVWMSSAKFALL